MRQYFPRISLCLLSALWATSLLAQALRHPWQSVSADAVVTMDQEVTNPRLMAFIVDSTLRATPLVAAGKDFKRRDAAWRTRRITASGGEVPSFNPEEVYQAAHTLREGASLLLATGQSRYADIIERALFNALPSWAVRRSSTVTERRVAAQALLDAVGILYARDRQRIYVNLYLNSFARLRQGKLSFTLDQITTMPFSPGIRFRFGELPEGRHLLRFGFRLPDWAPAEEVNLYVNGHEQAYELRNGYMLLEAAFQNKDEIYLSLPFAPSSLATPEGRVIVHGPLVCIPRKMGRTLPRPQDFVLTGDSAAHFVLTAPDWELVPMVDAAR